MTGRLLIFFFFLGFILYGQREKSVETVLDEMKSDPRFEDGGADWIQFSDQLSAFQDSRVHLNRAGLEELLMLPFLNKIQAFNLLQYRKKVGRIRSYYELLQVSGFNRTLIEWMQPFTDLETPVETLTARDLFSKAKHELALRYMRTAPRQAGFLNKQYTGDANAMYFRYRMNHKNRIFAGITMQKDAGETAFRSGWPFLSDFFSFHFQYNGRGTIRKILVGDYSINYGQGLALWSGFSYGKSSETTALQRFGNGIRRYTGADEYHYFRGVALEIRKSVLSYHLSLSRRSVDAALEDRKIVSIDRSGLHRTSAEHLKRNAASITFLSSRIELEKNHFELGLISQFYSFSHPLLRSSAYYRAHDFHGKSNAVVSLDYQWIFGENAFYGEVAMSENRGKAVTAGLNASPNGNLTFTMSFRRIENNYQTLFSSPFSEYGKSGEQGFYFGIRYPFSSRLSVKLYLDKYVRDWPGYQDPMPVSGRDFLVQTDWKWNNFDLYFRYRLKNQYPRGKYETGIQHVRIHIKKKINRNLKWANRVEFKSLSGLLSVLVYQELVFHSEVRPLSFHGRLTYFNIGDHRIALHAREDELPYTYNLRGFYDKGIVFYSMFRYRIKHLDLYLKFVHQYHPDAQQIGSGYAAVDGQYRWSFHVMLRYKFRPYRSKK